MESHKEVISKLKFIGKLQKGEKINAKLLYVQQEGIVTQLARTLLQDNRTKTLSFVQDTINKSFELITYYDRSNRVSERIMCNNLIDDLKKSKSGIVNLKDTYVDDIKFCCDLETLLQMIDAKLIEYNKYDNFTPPPPPPSIIPKSLFDLTLEDSKSNNDDIKDS
jgi:hypothetical protein